MCTPDAAGGGGPTMANAAQIPAVDPRLQMLHGAMQAWLVSPVDYINANDRPLGLYWFGEDQGERAFGRDAAVAVDEGVEAVEAALGLPLAGGGQHAHMATHNRLLGLGDLYLEVIGADPSLPAPPYPRWFDLDAFSGPPRLTNWVARCDDLTAEIAISPAGIGTPAHLERGDFRWEMAIPANGKLPFHGAFPALIHWHGTLHPARALPESGCRLRRMEIAHPQGAALAAHRDEIIDAPNLILLAELELLKDKDAQARAARVAQAPPGRRRLRARVSPQTARSGTNPIIDGYYDQATL